jgi:uracil-DNA glycosylase
MLFADHVMKFNRELNYAGKLPRSIRIMNPFRENEEVISLSAQFYQQFYSDTKGRKIILGINPGRLGAGATGIPFTDTKRLLQICGIQAKSMQTHEPSSVFIYKMIERFGGAAAFYSEYYINSVCPLGFVKKNEKGNWLNYNYYDDAELFSCMRKFIISNLKKQIAFGIDTNTAYVLGKKNAKFLELINQEENLFEKIIPLDHPRYIEQYKSRLSEKYLNDYLKLLKATRSTK